jgi:nicotinamidase-related amidase
MLEQLAQAGRPGLVVWPVHCVTGTWGHNIYGPLAEQLAQWEFSRQRAVRKVLKGEYPLTEHFGVFEADAPDEAIPSTQFNNGLAADLTAGVDVLFVAGEAGSHCVASSVDQLTRYLDARPGPRPRVVLLNDCMSPVTGFEANQQAFVQRASAWGADTMTSADAGALFN